MSPLPLNKITYAVSNVDDGNMSLKFGTDTEVARNRKNFLNNIGIPSNACAGINLVHGSEIIPVSKSDVSECAFKAKNGDALTTSEKDIFLFMMTSDCLPVTLFDPATSQLALVHCGWKSTEEKIVQKVISYFINKGSKAADILAIMGPCIHKKSYRFVDPIQKKLPGWETFLRDVEGGETEIDLLGYNIHQLLQSGIINKNIETSPFDTAAEKKYFSHYRSVKTGEKEGRFCTVVGMKN